MNEKEIQRLRELLGPEFSEEEVQQLFREDSSLGRDAQELQSTFRALQQQTIPGLSSDFADRVMAKVRQPFLFSWMQDFFSFPRLAIVSGTLAALFAALWLGPQFWREAPAPGLVVRETLGPDRQKTFLVRFAIQQPGAASVSVAGDFNQWNPTPLKSESKGVFSLQIPLGEGTYNYAFLVDGKKWVPDPSADRIVEDGFGSSNSLINL